MQFKFKTLAAAALLAAVSLPSFAVISTTATPSLVLYAFDIQGSGATYYRDLGSVAQITGATGNLTLGAPAASIFTSTFAAVASTDITWGIMGVSTVGAGTLYAASGFSAIPTNGADTNGILGGMTGTFGTFNALDLAANGYAKAGGEYTGNGVVGGDGTFATNAFDMAARATLNSFDLGLGVGSSLNLFKIVGGNTATVSQINVGATNGQALLGGVAGGFMTLLADGSVSWTQASAVTTPAAVPVPAAALLFGPALLAMVGVGRRNKKSV
ncbi:MAG: hypothetical protein AB9M53_02765 [Leptothrix sp. (in: b-proteobacteria)]